MDNDMKWLAIMVIGMFLAGALMAFADGGVDSPETKQYNACIANENNTHDDCKEILD